MRRPGEGVREGVPLVAAVVVAFTAGAVALALFRGEEFESSATVREAGSLEAARSATVARRALALAGARGEPASALLDRSEVSPSSGGNARVVVRAGDADAARRLAGAYARAIAARAGGEAGSATPADSERSLLRAALWGAGAGLLAGLVLALMREVLDVRRTSSRTVGGRLGAHELGRVPAPSGRVEELHGAAALDDPGGAAATAYAEAAARLVAEVGRGVVLVAGSVPGDHADHVAANLAVALSRSGRNVVLVELDVGRPRLRRLLALERGPGLSEATTGEVPLDEALSRVPGVDGLEVLTAGRPPVGDPGSVEALLEQLAARFDLVIVGGPPLLRSETTSLPDVDGVVLVVHLHGVRRSRRPRLERRLRELRAPLLGFVLVGAAATGPSADRASDAARDEGGRGDRQRDEQQEQHTVGRRP